MTGSSSAADSPIVVGVDGSAGSKSALLWAARQAQLTGASLHAVMSWHMPVYGYGAPGFTFNDYDLSDWAKQTLADTISEVLADYPAVKVLTSVEEGYPAVKLLEAAAGAQLLVVGSRGHGEFAGMLLGSVSEHCVHHAPCPVVVVGHDPLPA